MNCITITGNLTKDAELKAVGGKDVASFAIADNVSIKGEKVAIYFDCSVWGARAQVAADYLRKGGLVTVVGRLQPTYVKGEKAYHKVDVMDFTLPPRAAARDDEGMPF